MAPQVPVPMLDDDHYGATTTPHVGHRNSTKRSVYYSHHVPQERPASGSSNSRSPRYGRFHTEGRGLSWILPTLTALCGVVGVTTLALLLFADTPTLSRRRTAWADESQASFFERMSSSSSSQRKASRATAVKCSPRAKAVPTRYAWDGLGLLEDPALLSRTGVVHRGDLTRLQGAISRANEEKRPLRVGIMGGSFSAGGAVADIRDAYTEVLARLLGGSEGAPWEVLSHGAVVTNVAQGGAGFMLPLYCTDKVYGLVAQDPSVVPDVWIVEFAENFDDSFAKYEALLGLLMWDEERFGKPAVITAAVAKNFCWMPHGAKEREWCGLVRTFPWLLEAAEALDIPLVSFVHAVAPPLGLSAEKMVGDGEVVVETRALDAARQWLYAECGRNQHFGEYGHHVFAHLLYSLFEEAASTDTPRDNRTSRHTVSPLVLPATALEVMSRLSSLSLHRTLSCNLTLTQGHGVDLVPSRTKGYELWSEKDKIFGSRLRADKKQTWAPSGPGASIDFVIHPRKGSSNMCLLTYGANGMSLEAEFLRPAVSSGRAGWWPFNWPSKAPAAASVAAPAGQRRRGGWRWGWDVAEGAGEQGAGITEERETCTFHGGVYWTTYGVYRFDCSCQLPPRATTGEGALTVRLTNVVGKMQVAGLVLW